MLSWFLKINVQIARGFEGTFSFRVCTCVCNHMSVIVFLIRWNLGV